MVTSAPALALLCLFVTGLLDVVFKFYSMKPRSRGLLIFGIGCVWFICQSMYMAANGAMPVLSQPTVMYGALAALCVTASNIMLLEALGHLPVSMASTIYRLNTIPLIILATFFLGEHLDLWRSAGIVCGLISVLLLYHRDSDAQRDSSYFLIFLGIIIAACCIRALYGFTTKVGISQGADVDTMLLIGALGWCIGGLLYAKARENERHFSMDIVGYIILAGSIVFAVVWLLTKALQIGDASLVVPLANMGFVAAFILSVGLKIEALTLRKCTAILIAIASILLLTRSY